MTTDEDTAYTFAAGDFGFTDGDGDTLASVTVVTVPAAGSLALDGTAVTADAEVTKAELDGGEFKFTPAADENGAGYASFTFKVSDGTEESAATYTMTVDVTAVNDAPTGAPTISGAARVGQTLRASRTGIEDVDGLPGNESGYGYQWVRVDSGVETEISGATSRTYEVVTADEGKKLKVKVSYTDDGGTAEEVVSAETEAVGVGANTAPEGADRTVTTDEDTAYTFAAEDFGFTDGDGDALASVTVVTVPAAGSLTLDGTAVTADAEVTKTQLDGGELEFTPAADENGAGYASFTFKVSDGTEESAATYTMTVDVTAVNDAPTGVPTISGAARVGQTLSASRTGIEDVDGLPGNESGYGYQWVRVDSGVETDISGATSRTYEVVTADEGKKLKVKVSYTDDGGTAEEVVSAETEAVGANTVPEGADRTVRTDEDTAYTFAAADFGFTDGDGEVLASVEVVTVPVAGSLTLNSAAVSAEDRVTKTQLDGGELEFTPAADENGAGYASFTFKVSDGTEESTATYTMTIDVTAVNDAPEGADRTVTTDEDTAYTFAAGDFGFTDGDGDVLASVTVVTVPAAGSLTLDGTAVTADAEVTKTQLDGGELEFTPAADENGVGYASFTFKVSDGTEESTATYTMTIDVTAVNDAPTGADRTVTTDEDTAYTFAAGDFGFTDGDGDALGSVDGGDGACGGEPDAGRYGGDGGRGGDEGGA